MDDTNDITMLSESSDASNMSSKFSDIGEDNILTVNIKEMKEEEKRLKKKHTREELMMMRRLREEQLTKSKKEKAIKSMNYLLSTSQKYSKYFLDKFKNYDIENENKRKKQAKDKTEDKYYQEEIAKLEAKLDNNLNEEIPKRKTRKKNITPKYFTGGTLQPHQVEGLVWLKLLYENGVNGILADEMGLGKTIQVIALISYLMEKEIPGPYLIVAPLSTIPNWVSEFKRFAPKIPVVLFHGKMDERVKLYQEVKKKYPIDERQTRPVVITSYQVPIIEVAFIKSFTWQYVIVDEGHRIKNHESQLMTALKSFQSLNRLLLTGTPLQNNLTELWSLLNFLLPQFFEDADTFSSLFVHEDFEQTGKIIEQEQSTNIISTIHGVLNPFMLRRLKCDVLKDLVPKKEVLVYCPMTSLQRDLYKFIMTRNMKELTGVKDTFEIDLSEGRKKRKCVENRVWSYMEPKLSDDFDENSPEFFDHSHSLAKYSSLSKNDSKSFIAQIKMQNLMMMYKKVTCHPYLIHFPLVPDSDPKELLIDESIIEHSGKMKVLDAMLQKLKKRGHKVLIFSTLKIMLDIIEDYLLIRKYQYCRLDGSYSLEDRQDMIHSFNSDRDKFVFILSTRAGGLGLNLTAADTVILYDRDWNPQVDLQAEDRCHRIGQTKPVMVYSFISKGTIDERILQFSTNKRRLEKIVISKGKFTNPDQCIKKTTDLKELEKLLHESDHDSVVQSNGALSEEELEKLLDRSELYSQMKENQK